MTQHLSAAEYKKLPAPKKSKYGNQKTMVGGETFDSKKEAERWVALKSMEKAGLISHLERQPEFKLMSGQNPVVSDKGRQLVYKADFAYFEYSLPERQRVVEDVKGFKTDVYKLKKAFVQAQFQGLRIVEI